MAVFIWCVCLLGDSGSIYVCALARQNNNMVVFEILYQIEFNVDGSCNSRGGVGVGGLIRDDKGNWLAGFSSNDRQGYVLFDELFAIYHGITLLLQHGQTRANIESDSLEAIQLLTRRNELEFHEHRSLLLRITSLIDHALYLILHHIF